MPNLRHAFFIAVAEMPSFEAAVGSEWLASCSRTSSVMDTGAAAGQPFSIARLRLGLRRGKTVAPFERRIESRSSHLEGPSAALKAASKGVSGSLDDGERSCAFISTESTMRSRSEDGLALSQADTSAKVMSVCVSALQSKGFGVLETMSNGSKGRGLAGK